ncbi:HK97 family phage prohead protease [Vibrio parahaemolyticus]|nr:HK97 family phage prohead protease [Vibrio parahaemolyticus]EJG0013010.1 HK97 family phage prohead protease [Vibrio parahaemolyticus]EJS9799251.1 HK97 family phage prohead protease [Vibrio parahaemolyticus]
MELKNLDIQIKSFDDDGETGVFTAYANVKWCVDRARDCTVDGCFKWDKTRLPKMLLQHDYTKVVGTWLEIEEDDVGLRVKGQLAINTQLGRETYELLKLGALDSLSIGYIIRKERFDTKENINYLEDIEIREISIVTFECNQQSLIDSVKSDDLKVNYKSISEQNIEVEEDNKENTSETDINISCDEEQEQTESLDDQQKNIPNELIAKLDELVISIKLNQIL